MKQKYEEEQKEIIKNLESEIELQEKALENNKKFVELLNEENFKYNNYLLLNKQKLENIEESLSDFRNNFMHLNDLKNDLNKICF